VSSSDDAGVNSRFVRICRDGFGGDEVPIALDGKAELAADGLQFDDADVADLSVFIWCPKVWGLGLRLLNPSVSEGALIRGKPRRAHAASSRFRCFRPQPPPAPM
jgi:hypothetical protein